MERPLNDVARIGSEWGGNIYREQAKDPQMASELSLSNGSLPELSPSMILLVDDDPDIRVLTRTFLEHEGYSVLSSGDAERAMQIFRSVPQIDLVVTDCICRGGRAWSWDWS